MTMTRITISDPNAPQIDQRVSALYRGERVTGIVTSTSFSSPVDGVHPLDVIHIRVDKPITAPSGRVYDKIYIASPEGLASLEILEG